MATRGGYTIVSGVHKSKKAASRGWDKFYILAGCIVTEQMDGLDGEPVHQASSKPFV